MGYSALTVLTPPASEPVSIALARQHCRVDHTSDDNLLAVYITVARGLVENYTGRCLVSQQLLWSTADAPPGAQWPLTAVTPVILPLWLPYPLIYQQPIRLPRSPVVSVDAVAVSTSGSYTDTTLTAGTDYTYDLTCDPGRVLLQPSGQPAIGQHCAITFTTGYATNGSPAMLCMAILMIVAWLYEHRGDTEIAEIPRAAQMLMTPYRNVTLG